MRRWALAAGAAGGLLGITAALGAAFAVLSPAEDLRRHLAERLLTYYWGEPVTVAGPVTVSLRRRAVIEIAGISSSTYGEAPVRLSKLRISLASWLRLPFDPTIFALRLEDGRFEFPLVTDEDAAPGTLLSSPVAFFSVLPRLRLQNVAFDFADADDGWRFTLDVGHVFSRLRDGVEYMDASAKLNGTPVTLSFQFDREPRPPDPGMLPYGAVISIGGPGLKAALRTRSATAAFDQNLLMSLEASTSSLADLLGLAGIAPSINGRADLRAHLLADTDSVAMRGLALDIAMADGLHLSVTGGVLDLFGGTGVDLAAVAEIDTGASPAGSLRDIAVTRLSGRFQDGAHGLMLSDALVETNAFSQSLREIGPIEVAAIRRDDEGRVALVGINVQAGPEDQPVLRLKGDVTDLLDLRGITLSGSFDVPVSDLVVVPAATAGRLGRLVGEAALSDAGSSLALDRLTAEVKDSTVLSGKVSLEPAGAASENMAAKAVDVAFGTPRLAQLAPLLGASSAFTGPAAFDGKFMRTAESFISEGRFTLGRTEVDGRLTGVLRKDRPFISGKLSSPDIYADELLGLLGDGAFAAGPPHLVIAGASAPPGGSQLDLAGSTDLDIQVAAQRIEGGGSAASGLSARLLLEEGAFRADPVHVTFGGGRINAAITGAKGNRLRAKGSGEGWPLGSLFGKAAAFEIKGTAGLSFDLSADPTAADPLQSLDGSLVAHIHNAHLATGLLDLAGLGLFGGMFNPAVMTGETNLRCARVPLRLGDGAARTDPVIVAETEHVEAEARGTINFARGTIDLVVVPRPLGGGEGSEGYPFTIKGPIKAPRVALGSGVAEQGRRAPGCSR